MLNDQQKLRFCQARRLAIARDFSFLNPEQQEGVLATEGPLLLLAGAGSGKTTVLINRVSNLIRYGCGSDSDQVPQGVTEDDLAFLEHYAATGEGDVQRQRTLCALNPPPPWSILAITFTNKAAGELKNRLAVTLGPKAQDVWAFTFHAACVRILRRHADRLGFPPSFTIYDTDDSMRVIRSGLKELNLSEKVYPPRQVLSNISRAKTRGKLAADYQKEVALTGDYYRTGISNLYEYYEKSLWNAGALDFDDLILHTVRLLRDFSDVREYYQHHFRYVLVDEYQDTNSLQYQLTALLSGGLGNLCVVGDDDQSIYSFRGATIENILTFEKKYPGCRVIRLEQNYRSTSHILDAANAVIANNQERKGKKLWTKAGEGELVEIHCAENEQDEARFIADSIMQSHLGGRLWRDHAILYRMNAQSYQLELACKRASIPYRIIGGTRFFDRAEVKDMLAYLVVLNNPDDDLRLLRIINNPPRNIGTRTLERAQDLAKKEGVSLYHIITRARSYPDLERSAPSLARFVDLMNDLHDLLCTMPLDKFYHEMLERTGYAAMLTEKNTDEDRARLENAQELQSSIRSYLDEVGSTDNGDKDLFGFLDQIALYTDLDNHDPNQDCVVMMTVHSAKGLEFPAVFVAGMEDNLFPDSRTIGDPKAEQEERRLCYVAMTRAMDKLCFTCARHRLLFGQTRSNSRSRFLYEIPDELLQNTGLPEEDKDQEDFTSEWEDFPGGPVHYSTGSAYRGGGSRRYGNYPGSSSSPRKSSSGSSWGTPYTGISRSSDFIPRRQAPKPRDNSPLSLKLGDTVRHPSFGTGTILSIQAMGYDTLLEIAFEKEGTKRMMLSTARRYLEKL